MKTCPHCSQKAIPLSSFVRSSARQPVCCPACGEFAYAPRWAGESLSVIGQLLFWFSPLVALLMSGWAPVLLAVPLYCLLALGAFLVAAPMAYDNDRSKTNFRRPVSFGRKNAKGS